MSQGAQLDGGAATRSSLRLVVENLGPIQHASVELKPLTVLIGRNNTGKTYLSRALYAVRRAVLDARRGPSTTLTTEERLALEDVVLRESHQSESGKRAMRDVRVRIEQLQTSTILKATSWTLESLSEVGQLLERQLCTSFGVPSTNELRTWEKLAPVAIELHRTGSGRDSACLFGTTGSSVSSLGKDVTVTLDPLDFDSARHAQRFRNLSDQDHHASKEVWLDQRASRALQSATWHGFLEDVGLSGRAHYLPAGRSGLLNAWTDVVRLRLELERESYGLPTARDPDLDGVALDFISSLAGLLGTPIRDRRGITDIWRRQRNPVTRKSLSLLRQVMDGKIYSGSGDDMVPTLGYEQGGHRIGIRGASSMVADLAPLAMWIDRIVRDGDLLIIDEPESHLHPEAIRLVARVLVRLVGEGVSVVCATHSPVLLHELSNCLLLGQRNDLVSLDPVGGYDISDRLSLDDIAVHRFHRAERNEPALVTKVEIEPDWGIPEDEYVDVATRQSEDTSRLIDGLA